MSDPQYFNLVKVNCPTATAVIQHLHFDIIFPKNIIPVLCMQFAMAIQPKLYGHGNPAN